jgi:outer membrane protein OmpA-like peptidoglycan-associated protein
MKAAYFCAIYATKAQKFSHLWNKKFGGREKADTLIVFSTLAPMAHYMQKLVILNQKRGGSYMRTINSLVFIGASLFLFGSMFPLAQATSEATEISEQAANVADKKTEIAQEEADLKKEAAELEEDKATLEKEKANLAEDEAKLHERAAALSEQRATLEEKKASVAEEEAKASKKAAVHTAEFEEQLATLNAKETDRGLVLTLGDVVFESDQATLKAQTLENLYPMVTFLREHPKRHVLIEGHTDNTGPETYNLDLSQERAAAVRSFLVRNGIDPEGITARGYGEAYPMATNTTQEGRQENRRVEIVVLREGRRVSEVMR